MHPFKSPAPRRYRNAFAFHRRRRAVAHRSMVALGALLGFAMVANVAHADTLGGRMQAISTDLGTGFGFALETGGYVLGAIALLAGIYVMWKHQQNPNGPHKMSYGLTSIIAGGAFLSITYIAGYASHTVSDAGPDNTGASQQMRFEN